MVFDNWWKYRCYCHLDYRLFFISTPFLGGSVLGEPQQQNTERLTVDTPAPR